MKCEKPIPNLKSYDAIEDAIELSKRDPAKTWDDLAGMALKQAMDRSDQDTSQHNDKIGEWQRQ